MPIATRHAITLLSVLALAAGHAFAGPGALDRTYAPAVTGGAVYAMSLQADGKLVIGGAFTSVNGSTARARLARLYSDGSLDSTFLNTGTGVSGIVWSLAVQTDNRIVIGGDFSSINGTPRVRIARLNPNGTVDGSFVPTNTLNGSVLAVAVQANNAVVIGGNFSGGTFPSWNARLNADGTTDAAFSSFPNGPVNAIAIQSDGKIVIGGAFTTVNGAARNRIARLNADGSLDNTFQNGLAGASAIVRCLQIQTDGKILIGGDFTTVNGIARGCVARLNSSGSLDTGFNSSPGANAAVYALATQPDSSLLIGGSFSFYSSVSLSRIARLYADGTRDTAFTNFGINNLVQAIAVQNDGGTLIGGTFTTINNTNWPSLGRLYGNQYPPEFVIQPVSRNTNVGANVTFSAQVSNPTTSSFQWRKDGTNISGAMGAAYSLFNVQLSDAGNYSAFVSNGTGGTTSTNALLQVGIAPALTGQSGSVSVTQGQSASFTVTATGTPLYYFWRKNGAFMPGQTNALLTFASVVPANAATYTCQVSNFLGSITSTGAVLTIGYPPTISVQPLSQTVGIGSNFTVSVTASGNPAIAYQWRTNGTRIPGATASSFTVTDAQTGDSSDFDVVITNSMGSITSSVAAISVVYYPPAIGQQPVGGNVVVGSDFALNVFASGTAPLHWQWRTNDTPIPGATASSYAITFAQLSDAGSYDVVVTNNTGSVTSMVAVVNVGYAPVVVRQPVSATNTLGGSNTFSCIVTGSAPINLQWVFNDNPIADATNGTLTLTNLQAANIGYYALAATNIFGGTISSNAALNLAGYDFGIWQGLVAYYPFNGNANDESGNNHQSTNNGAALVNDRFTTPNQAMSFDGLTNFISTGVGTLNDYPLTLSVWFATTEVNSITRGMVSIPLSLAGSGARLGCENGKVEGGSLGGQGPQTLFSPFAADGRWHHALVSCTPAGDNLLFLDGLLVAEDQRTPTLALSLPLQIGRELISPAGDGSGTRNIHALLDDVRIYNRALSSNEVASLYALEADLPVITQQPLAQTVNAGSTATFTFAATAYYPLTYQWRKNSTPIAGATNLVLTLTNVRSADVAFYSVTVSNAVAGVVSSSAQLNIAGYADPTWSGLVAYYPFNGNANDESGNAHHPNVISAITSTADRFAQTGLAYHFDTSYILYTNFMFNLAGPYTLSFWGKLNAFKDGGAFMELNMGTDCNGNPQLFETLSSVRYSHCSSGGGLPFGTASALTNSWHHFTAAVAEGGLTSIYLDGALISVTSEVWPVSSMVNFTVGASGNTAGPMQFGNIDLDDIRIYNRALSADEVAYLYQLESQTTPVAPLYLTTALSAGPALNLLISGVPGRSYILQSSTNLLLPIAWLPVLTNAADANGAWLFTDTNLNSAQKFYRVATP